MMTIKNLELVKVSEARGREGYTHTLSLALSTISTIFIMTIMTMTIMTIMTMTMILLPDAGRAAHLAHFNG